MNFKNKKILIFVVAFNAAPSLELVLKRIPEEVFKYDYEILIIDDSSTDNTFSVGRRYQMQNKNLNLTVLFNPVNQGYGGNQKLGYCYAIRHGFDVVILLHGDGQYPPEMIEPVVLPILNNEADAVFGSRMMTWLGALQGGMPLYKYVGNRILTCFQNFLLGTRLSEFHSGFRAYSVPALKKIPFQRNTGDFHFDTEIIIQLVHAGFRIQEIPIPTHYGDEVCHVNGLKYALDVFKTMLAFRLHKMSLVYQLNFDVDPQTTFYEMKLPYCSSHSMAIERVPENAKVMDIGCGTGLLLDALIKSKKVSAYGIDQNEIPSEKKAVINFVRLNLDNIEQLPEMENFDRVLMLDIIEHLSNPEIFLDAVRVRTTGKKPLVIATTGNVGFFVMRLQLLMNNFNYGKHGILDKTHKRLFTFATFKRLFEQCGYKITKVQGIPAPFPKALGLNFVSQALLFLNQLLIRLNPGLFSYQIYLETEPAPVVEELLNISIRESEARPFTNSQC